MRNLHGHGDGVPVVMLPASEAEIVGAPLCGEPKRAPAERTFKLCGGPAGMSCFASAVRRKDLAMQRALLILLLATPARATTYYVDNCVVTRQRFEQWHERVDALADRRACQCPDSRPRRLYPISPRLYLA